MGDSMDMLERSVLVDFSAGRSDLLALERLDLPLLPDRTEATSAALLASTSFTSEELRGLSAFLLELPGILDRKERKERDDSLVSDLLRDGYDCKASPYDGAPGPLAAPGPAPLELELPITGGSSLSQSPQRKEVVAGRDVLSLRGY
jgi:hypothetical protein